MSEEDSQNENDSETATASGQPARSRLFVVLAALVILGIGTWVLWSITHTPESPRVEPSARLKILGRDDEATRREEQDLNRKTSASASPAASASSTPSAR